MSDKPTKPSPEAADEAAKNVKGAGRPTKASIAAAAELERVEEQQNKFLAQLSELLTEATSGAMESLDVVYADEIKYCMDKPGQKEIGAITFALNEKEKDSVGLCIALGLKQSAPEFLQTWGFPIMLGAVTLMVTVPRISMASQLSGIRKDMKAEREALKIEQPADKKALPHDRMPKN